MWLSAFVLKTFAQAQNLIYIDPAVLTTTAAWITSQQKSDGSFEPVGFMHHQDLVGGLQGNTALTAYVMAALLAANEQTAAAKAKNYLEGALTSADFSNDSYGLAITAYALELAKSSQRDAVYATLVKAAKQDDNGLYWGELVQPQAQPTGGEQPNIYPQPNHSATIETTGYALLALIAHGDRITASAAARWLVSKRNAYGGWTSTQDTVVGLQALSKFVTDSKSDVNATLTLHNGNWQKQIQVGPDNFDVVQIIETPTGGTLSVEVNGKGQAVLQAVRRYKCTHTT